MLVLTRRIGETIVIDGDIQVTVVSIKGDRVRLGISAPDTVRGDRQGGHQRRGTEAEPATLTQPVSTHP